MGSKSKRAKATRGRLRAKVYLGFTSVLVFVFYAFIYATLQPVREDLLAVGNEYLGSARVAQTTVGGTKVTINMNQTSIENILVDRSIKALARKPHWQGQASRTTPTSRYGETSIQEYAKWHNEMRRVFTDQELFASSDVVVVVVDSKPQQVDRPKLGILYLDLPSMKGGLADRMSYVSEVLRWCIDQQRMYFIKWYGPNDLEDFLVPGLFNWTLPTYVIQQGSNPTATSLEAVYPDHIMFSSQQHDTDQSLRRARIVLIPSSIFRHSKRNLMGDSFFSIAFQALFRPSMPVQMALDDTMNHLGLVPGQYDAVHCRIGHPAHRDAKRPSYQKDKVEGGSFEDRKDRVRAVHTAIHALQCARWLSAERHNQHPNYEGERVLPTYFFADSANLVESIANPKKLVEHRVPELYSNLTTELSQSKVVVRSNVRVAHLASAFPPNRYDASQLSAIATTTTTTTPFEAHVSTFVDLYVAAGARCISLGVGRFAYLASSISGTTCVARHEVKSLSVSWKWGMQHMTQEVPECPIPTLLS